MRDVMKILLLGGPGSGKSTVGQRLAQDMGWPWVSSGAILRESTEPWVIERLKTAQLFDDEMVSDLVFGRLEGVENAIIDGYPRTLRQAEIIVEKGLEIDIAVEVVVPIEESLARLSLRGREQDDSAIVEERWNDYDKTKTEILAYLAGNGVKVLTADGVGAPDEVYNRVVEMLRENWG